MNVCRRENCIHEPVQDGLGFCPQDLAAYLQKRERFAQLAGELRAHMPAVFALLTDTEAVRLSEFIVGHAATGARGFSNEYLLAGEVAASFDALDEAKEQQADKNRRVVFTRTRGTSQRLHLAGGFA